MSNVIQRPFYNIEDRNGTKYVVLFDNDFKNTVGNGTRRYFFDILNGVVKEDATAENKELAKLFAVPVIAFAKMALKYLRYNYYSNEDNIFEIQENIKFEPKEEDDTDNFLDSFRFEYQSCNPRRSEVVSKMNAIKNDTDPVKVAEMEKLKAEYSAINEFAQSQRIEFVFLLRYAIDVLADKLRENIELFKKDEPISFNDLLDILQAIEDPVRIQVQDGVDVGSSVSDVEMRETMFGVFIIGNYEILHFNGKETKDCNAMFRIFEYGGLLKPSAVGVSVLTDDVKTTILERAQKYIKYVAKPSYAYHTGNIVESFGWFKNTMPGTGRCMVDVGTLAQVNPNFQDYFPRDAQPDGRDDDNKNPQEKIDINNMLEEDKLKLSPYVYIFSFVAKKWARTLVDNISDIAFREDAFSKLVIEPNIKDLMFSLVDTSKHSIAVGKDIIDNKGGGSIFLLAGNPGCGKTLTAETMAETLKKPLYMVGVGELGTDTKALESSLIKVLNTAAAWDAILLLDECDIFMEKRQNMDVFRNAMVGVFLRLLEYYPGILFLTTNRASNIDEAFFSRISLAIQYPDLDAQKRAIIWRNILDLYKDVFDTSTIDVNSLSNMNINGRQIKNCVRLVLTYCSYKNKLPTTSDFVEVLGRMQEFQQTHSKQ